LTGLARQDAWICSSYNGEMMRFDTELPQDFQDCIEKWRGYSKTNLTEEGEK
jgi:hypothetical protein